MDNIKLLAQKFCDYSVSIRGYKKDTIKRYKHSINFYCRFAKINNISQVSEESVRALFFYGRTNRNWSVNTFLCYHKSLLVFFRWCINQKYMTQKNPLLNIEKPKLEKNLPAKLTQQETLRLLEIVDNYPWPCKFLRYRNYAIFATFIFCGLRKMELLNLKFSDVDIENLSVLIKNGKGNKDRIIPMSQKLATILKKYVEERNQLKKTCPEFFTSLPNNMGLSDTGIKNLTKKIQESSGIKFCLHKLRSSFACLLLQSGCDIYSLSRMMGHSSISTTQIYLYSSLENLRTQMAKHPLNDI